MEILKLLKTLGIHNVESQKTSQVTPFNENTLGIFIGKQKIGSIGEIDLSLTDKLIKNPAFGFEIYPDNIPLFFNNPKIRKTSRYQLSSRDLNIVVNSATSYAEIESVIKTAKVKHLVSFSLINTFEGKNIPKDYISMTFRFIFQSNSMSLTETDIVSSMNQITEILIKIFKITIRS